MTLRRVRGRVRVGGRRHGGYGRTWLDDVLNWRRVPSLALHFQLHTVVVVIIRTGFTGRIRVRGHLLLGDSFLFPEFGSSVLEPHLQERKRKGMGMLLLKSVKEN